MRATDNFIISDSQLKRIRMISLNYKRKLLIISDNWKQRNERKELEIFFPYFQKFSNTYRSRKGRRSRLRNFYSRQIDIKTFDNRIQ